MGVLVDDLLLLDATRPGPPARAPIRRPDATRGRRRRRRARRAPGPHRRGRRQRRRRRSSATKRRLRQVFANLLAERVHAHAGGHAGAGRRRERGADAVIEVRDNGPGLSADEAAHVFEQFWRADARAHGPAAASGLGLSIVRAIAAAHGGTAEVVTDPRRGRDLPRHPVRCAVTRSRRRPTSTRRQSIWTTSLPRWSPREEADERFGRAVDAVEDVLAVLDAAVGDPRGELGGARRVGVPVVEGVEPLHPRPLAHDVLDVVQRRRRAFEVVGRDVAAQHDAAAIGEPAQHGVEQLAADVVEEDVDASRRELLEARRDVFGLVVDARVEAELVDDPRALGRAAGDADDVRAAQLRDLARDRPDARPPRPTRGTSRPVRASRPR